MNFLPHRYALRFFYALAELVLRIAHVSGLVDDGVQVWANYEQNPSWTAAGQLER